jgi:hypothetical protein
MELIAGVFGAMIDFTPRYEPKMDGQTPDWLFLDRNNQPQFFADVVNFHLNEAIEKKIEEAMQAGLSWRGELPDSQERLFPSLRKKTSKYKELADKVDLPLVTFLYGWFDAFLHPMEIESCLRNQEWGLFRDYSQLSGVYHFDDALSIGRGWAQPGYHFHFYANSAASRPLHLDDGIVPLPIPDPLTSNEAPQPA